MLNSPGKAPPVKRGPSPSQLRFLPTVLTTTLTAALPSSSGSVAVMLISVRLPPIWLNSTPSHSGMTSLTVKLPTTLIAAPAPASETPVPVMLAWAPEGMSPPPHVYGVREEAAPAAPVDATTMPVAATSAVIKSTKRRIQLPLLVSPLVAGHAV